MTATLGSFALSVRFTLKPGAEPAFDALTRRTVDRIRDEEPGTLVYVCHEVSDHPGQRIFYEMYRDQEAFEEHESRGYVKAFLEQREPLLDATEVDFLSPFDGKMPDRGGA